MLQDNITAEDQRDEFYREHFGFVHESTIEVRKVREDYWEVQIGGKTCTCTSLQCAAARALEWYLTGECTDEHFVKEDKQ